VRWYKSDLHIHSVLSPCGSLEMGPHAVMATAKQKGLDIVAITDHNSARNLYSYSIVAAKHDLIFIPGIEVQTSEEIHTIVLFHDIKSAATFSKELHSSLLPIENDPEYFGDQVVVDESEQIADLEPIALINSSRWSFDELLAKAKEVNGFAFPAHVDADSYSIIGQLGFIPENDQITALGITAKCDDSKLKNKFSYLKKYNLIRNSDAHYLKDIGSGITEFYLKSPSLEEIILACNNIGDRKIDHSKIINK